MELGSLSEVLVAELGDLYSAEQQLVEGLPGMASAAHAYGLREAFEAHLEETRGHVLRLEQAFSELGVRFAPTKTCNAMRGLLEDAATIVEATGDPVALDAALIGAAQRVEHFELAGYGTARALADELGLGSVSALLERTLDEEGKANKALTKLAQGGMLGSGINRLAAERTESDEPLLPVAESPEPGSEPVEA